MDNRLLEARAFFREHAGFSYRPGKETPAQGRARCAARLAAAERDSGGLTFEWEIDPDCDSSDFSDDPDPWPLWVCICRDESGAIVDSLSAIDFGRDGDPWSNPYRRVVQAEIALNRAVSARRRDSGFPG